MWDFDNDQLVTESSCEESVVSSIIVDNNYIKYVTLLYGCTDSKLKP